MPGIKMKTDIALFKCLFNNFFRNMYTDSIDVKMLAIDVVASLITATVFGATVAVAN